MLGNRFHKWMIWPLSFMIYAAAVWADPNDQQDIVINSQAFEYNHKTGTAVYTGKVLAKQGTRKLWGDKLEVFRGTDGKIGKIIVTGLPAKLEQEGDIYEAALIEYDLIKDTVRSPQNTKGQTNITLKPRARS